MINLLLLILLILIGLLYFTGLGWFVTTLLLQIPNKHKGTDIPLIQMVPLMMVVGMITNYGLTLIVQSINTSLIIGAILSIGGLILMIKNLANRVNSNRPGNPTISRWIGVIVTCGVLLIPFLVEPISRYDARTIWFFHAKMIYYAGTIGLEAGWQNPFINFSHRDYPNLIPVISAQISSVMGYWNEYLPKISVFYVLIPGIIWMFSLARKTYSFLILFAFIPFSFSPWLWNGYMDGLLSFFFCIALLLIGEYFKTSKMYHLISALVCMFLLINLKNEGLLALLSLILALTLSFAVYKRQIQVQLLIHNHWRTILGFVILILPSFVWSYHKMQWGLVNDLEIGSADSVMRFLTRLEDGSFLTILKSEISEIIHQLIVFCFILFAATTWKTHLPKSLLPVLLTTSIYFLGITAVYLLTPRDLGWHLITSVSRTMMTINGGIIVAWYMILVNLEHHKLSNESKISLNKLE